VVNTGKHTARAANDKVIVRESSSEDHVWWGEYNRPYSTEKFDELFNRVQGFLQGRDVFVQDCYVGADRDYQLPVRIITEQAWHSYFARNMFILPRRTRNTAATSPTSQ
jgi:phosphoenolpyruvate carboxykinase (ATP)